jgi:hypothetical protein
VASLRINHGGGLRVFFMSKDPAFLFYPNDYLGGTMGFTIEQHGLYIMALVFQFNNGHFSEIQINSILQNRFKEIKHKFKTDGKLFWNERLDLEKEKRSKYVESRQNNGRAFLLKKDKPLINKKISNKHMGLQSIPHMENENEDEDENKKEKKSKYLDYVFLTSAEYERLVKECGKKFAERCIFVLDEWFSNGGSDRRGKYSDHNKCIRKWVMREVLKEMPKEAPKAPQAPPPPPEDPVKAAEAEKVYREQLKKVLKGKSWSAKV